MNITEYKLTTFHQLFKIMLISIKEYFKKFFYNNNIVGKNNNKKITTTSFLVLLSFCLASSSHGHKMLHAKIKLDLS